MWASGRHFLCRIPATTPLAGIDGGIPEAFGTQALANGANLLLALFRDIAVGGAVIQVESRRVTKSSGDGMAKDQDMPPVAEGLKGILVGIY